MHPIGIHRAGTFLLNGFNAITVVAVITLAGVGSLAGCGTSSSFTGDNPSPQNGQGANAASVSPRTPTPMPFLEPSCCYNEVDRTQLPRGAIVQGSFTVFADPPNPIEGQDYFVHIRIRLPSSVLNYQRSDLSGTLVGTDGYTHTIGAWELERFNPAQGSSELILFIPGARRGVSDTLRVTSRVLSESQTIFIRFG